jgi:hypothetical protein
MELRDIPTLKRWLAREDDTTIARVKGDGVKIDLGEQNWRPDRYSDPLVNRSLPVVGGLMRAIPEIAAFKLWYDPTCDFHHIGFEHRGESYDVRWYKVCCLTRTRDNAEVLFGPGQDHKVAEFFELGKYLKEENWFKLGQPSTADEKDKTAPA